MSTNDPMDFITMVVLGAQTMAHPAMHPRAYVGERIDRRDGSKRFTKRSFKERMKSKRARQARKLNRSKL